MTFEEFLLSCAKREDGSYPYGYVVERPMDFMCLGTTPALLKIVWNAAIASSLNKIETKNNKYYELRIEEVDFNNKTILACAESAMTDLESELRKLLTA